MAKGRREIPPCSKTYGFPIFCASFVPLAEIAAAAEKDGEGDGAVDALGGGDGGGGSAGGGGGGGGGGGDRLVAALGGGGGEARKRKKKRA